jgi:hypothetical protein
MGSRDLCKMRKSNRYLHALRLRSWEKRRIGTANVLTSQRRWTSVGGRMGKAGCIDGQVDWGGLGQWAFGILAPVVNLTLMQRCTLGVVDFRPLVFWCHTFWPHWRDQRWLKLSHHYSYPLFLLSYLSYLLHVHTQAYNLPLLINLSTG